MEPIRQLPDLIQAFEDTISVEQQERRRINSLVNIVERYCAGVSDEFLNQFETGSQKYTRHLLHADAEDKGRAAARAGATNPGSRPAPPAARPPEPRPTLTVTPATARAAAPVH